MLLSIQGHTKKTLPSHDSHRGLVDHPSDEVMNSIDVVEGFFMVLMYTSPLAGTQGPRQNENL